MTPLARRLLLLLPVVLFVAAGLLSASDKAPASEIPPGFNPDAPALEDPAKTEATPATTPAPESAASAAPVGEIATSAEHTTQPTERPESAPAETDEVHGLLKLGESLTGRADYPAAEIAYRQALKLARTHEATTATLLGLARMHRKEGSFTKAVAIYQKFCKEFPDDPLIPDALLDLGRTQRAMGAHKSALSSFYSVINSSLKVPADRFDHYQLLAKTAQFEIAETYFLAGDFNEAAKYFSRVRLLDLDPADRARAHFKSAFAQQLGGDLNGAVITLRQFLDQSPDDEHVPEARYLLSTILRSLNRSEEALQETLALLRAEQARTATDPKRWAYWQRRTGNQLANEFFAAGDTLNALSIYQNLATLSADQNWRLPLVYQTALCHERLRQIAEARRAYETIIAALPSDAVSTAAPELADLARMAAWRLQHLDWHDSTDRQLAIIFETTTGRGTEVAAKPASTTPAHDPSGNPVPPLAAVR